MNPNDADNHQPLLDLKSPSPGVAPSVGSTFDARRDVLEHLKARHQLHKKKRGSSSSKRTQGIQTAPGEMPRSSSLTDSSGIPSSLVSSSPGASLSGLATNSMFFCFLSVKTHCLEGKSMTPLRGDYFSCPFFSATPSSPSWTLDSPRALLPELQRYKDTVRCGVLGAEVPGHRQQQLTQTLIVRLFKTHFFTSILNCEKSTE